MRPRGPRPQGRQPAAESSAAIPACGAPLALAPGGEPVEVADDVEVFEEIEPLHHLVLLQETELATDGRFLDREGVRARRRLTPAPHRDEKEERACDARRQHKRRGTPPPHTPTASRLELLSQLG